MFSHFFKIQNDDDDNYDYLSELLLVSCIAQGNLFSYCLRRRRVRANGCKSKKVISLCRLSSGSNDSDRLDRQRDK